MFGFLAINYLLHIFVIGTLSIIQTYLTLSNQNYEWWWRAFLTGFSGCIYCFIYSMYYLITEMEIDLISSDLVYILYMLVVSVSIFMLPIAFVVAAGIVWFAAYDKEKE